MMVPGLLYLLINNYLPMVGIFIAFKKLDYSAGIFKSPWVGLRNFKFLFATSDIWIIIRNTVVYNIVFIILETVLGIWVAIMLADLANQHLARLAQVTIILPELLSLVICSYIVFAFLSQENGIMNNTILPALGLRPIGWYNEKGPWPVILTIVYLWLNIGSQAIIYLASIVGINKELYETADLDGASRFQKVIYITVPCIKPTIVTLLLLSVGSMFYSSFGLFYLIPHNSGMLFDVTATLDTYVYNALMHKNNVGMASAAGLFQSVVGFILVLTANKITSRLDPDNALF
ncbi:MAG: sugar ABC transporter permease [Firmicutes bacterium]|nr:sugar ABC transporter permease [Bacillota bacterium]